MIKQNLTGDLSLDDIDMDRQPREAKQYDLNEPCEHSIYFSRLKYTKKLKLSSRVRHYEMDFFS